MEISKGSKKFLESLLFFSAFIVSSSDIGYAGQWSKTYGTATVDHAYSVQQTSDGGFIVAGETGDVPGSPPGPSGGNAWVWKLDANGNMEWQKTYGHPTFFDRTSFVRQTAEGGYIVAGQTHVDLATTRGWILKLDALGGITWQKAYGGSSFDIFSEIHQTSDKGYIVAGGTLASGAGDFWVLKLDGNGIVVWQKTYGGNGGDSALTVQQTSDEGYVVAGQTQSFGAGSSDAWVLKLSSTGVIQWQKAYGGSNWDRVLSIQQTLDLGYIAVGETSSFGAGKSDFWVLKLDANGNILWEKAYGGSKDEVATSVQQTAEGGYIVAGWTESFGSGDREGWTLKLDANGNIQWQKTYGGTGAEDLQSIRQLPDGFVAAGGTASWGAGNGDAWVLKLDEDGNITGCQNLGNSNATVTPTSATVTTTSASGVNTAVTPQVTSATVVTTSAVPGTVCASILVRWSGTTAFSMKITSRNEDSSGDFKFQNVTYHFSGTADLYSGGDHLEANGEGCYIKLISSDGAITICVDKIAQVSTDVQKSKTDQLLLVGTGTCSGDFSNVGGKAFRGIAYLDSKGTLKKDGMGALISIGLNGKTAGGSDLDFTFSGNFKSTLTRE